MGESISRDTDVLHSAMDLRSLDVNLLVAFDALARERSVTGAAQRLGLTQPAMSNALARLRRLFADPLFVRAAAGMQPTPFAERLAEPVARACELLEEALRTDGGFDPATTTRRTFTFYLSEVGEFVFLPKVLRALQARVPRVDVRVRRIPEQGAEALAAGDADLAIGIFPRLGAGFYQQRLYGDHFVCIARVDHPEIGGALSLPQYLAADHAVVAFTGTGHDTALENALRKQGLRRRALVTVPHFLVLPAIVAQSDLIATIPARMAAALQPTPALKVLPSPLKLPRIEIRQYWHERCHQDAANRWLRQLVADVLRE